MAQNDSRAVTYAPVYNIDATGADQAALQRAVAEIQRIDREIEGRSIAAIHEAKERLILR
jgi:hypothetical protein